MERAEGEVPLLPPAGNASDLARVIYQVIISDLREDVYAEFKLLCEKATELGFNATKVIDHMSDFLDRLGSTMPTATVSEKETQLRNDGNVIVKRRNALTNETDLRFSRVARQLAPLKRKKNTASAHVPGRNGSCQMAN